MDTEKYKVLLRAVDTGSFTAAAEELGYTPSGVTHMMNALEEDLGLTLLHRSRHGVALTEAGKDLIEPMRRLVAEADHLDESVSELLGMERGHVAVASGASFARYMLPEAIARFHERYPKITLELSELGGAEMRAMVAEHRIGMAFLTRRESDTNFISLCSDDMLAIVPEDSPLAQKRSVSLKDLEAYPYIGVHPDYDHDVEDIIRSWEYGQHPLMISRDEQTVMAMVREGLGVSIVAGLHVAFYDGGIAGIPLEPRYVRDVGIAIVSKDGFSPAERKFLEVTREVVGELIEDGVVDPPLQ